MSLEEEEFYEPEIREIQQTDFVLGAPVEVPGADYDIIADEVELPNQYLKSVQVKLSGGAGADLVEDTDYTVNLRTGVVSVVAEGELDGQAQAWVAYVWCGIDNIALRQLANRTASLKADIATIMDEIVVIEGVISGLDVVPSTRQVTAGAGLTGGGDLSADRTFDIGAHADGSIVVNADTVRVGVLATDAQHGERGGGNQHVVATQSVNGFMGAADKAALDKMTIGAVRLMVFGWGEDGDVTVSSGTTTLTRDMHYRNLTLSGTGKINTAGYAIYVSDTLDITAAGAGAIFNNGGNGGNAVAPNGTSGGAGGTAGTAAPGVTVAAGAAGRAGATTPNGGNGTVGQTGLGVSNGYGAGAGGAGGTGGAAGSGGSSGSAAGSAGNVTDVLLGRLLPFLARAPSNTSDSTAPAMARIGGGAGGAGGSSGGGISSNGHHGGSGGGSGAGGGVVCVFARRVNRGAGTATGCITANGGNGGNGSANVGNTAAGGGSGGGAGGGGLVFLLVGEWLGTEKAGAIACNGGVGGNGATTGGTGAAGGGAEGGDGGRAVLVQLATAEVTITDGTASGAPAGTSGGAAGTLSAAA